MTVTVVLLAAGMGRRFGGPKQLVPVGPAGESILDYNAFDAVTAGCDRLVVVTRPELEAEVRNVLDRSVGERAEIAVALQRIAPGRAKPYGTAEAVVVAAPHIDGPFGVANADDLYGPGSFAALVDHLQGVPSAAAVVGFALRDTVPSSGSVTRAFLDHRDGLVRRMRETHGIERVRDGWHPAEVAGIGAVAGDELVSMNLLGLPYRVLGVLRAAVEAFVESGAEGEVYLPEVVDDLLQQGALEMRLLSTIETWVGMTNPEDLDLVEEHARARTTSPLRA
ncbi:MAG: nucleotidyltransferase family protein [Acidimicrobiales bacterium]